ncbi:MAG TPA: hypothetical protein VJZ26_15100 [Blastocatellia bacterium]|nr:hypothetical protein [Blastocatellia bacterium]
MATVKVTITIGQDTSVTATPDPANLRPTDKIQWSIIDNSASSFVINIDNWQLVEGTTNFASPFSKTGNPDFRTNAGPTLTTSVTSDPVLTPDTTWNYDIRLQPLSSFGKSFLADPRVVISSTPTGGKKPKKTATTKGKANKTRSR